MPGDTQRIGDPADAAEIGAEIREELKSAWSERDLELATERLQAAA